MDTFAVLAEANRRQILQALCGTERSVGDLVGELDLPQPTVSKHLKILRRADFVRYRVSAQKRLYVLNAEPFQHFDEWLQPYRVLWTKHLGDLEQFLDSEGHE